MLVIMDSCLSPEFKRLIINEINNSEDRRRFVEDLLIECIEHHRNFVDNDKPFVGEEG